MRASTIPILRGRWPRWLGFLVAVVAPWLLLGLVRASFRIGFSGTPEPWSVLGRTLALVAFWVPAAPWLYRLGRRGRPAVRMLLAPEALLAVVLEPAWAGLVVRPSVFADGTAFLTWVIDRLDLNLFTAAAVVGIGVVRRYTADRLALAAGERARAAALRQAEFDLLNSQIQPHFLFNALNTVVELVHRDATLAARFLADLDRLFERSVAADGRPETSLADELEWLRAYLAVQRQRFGPRLTVVFDVPDAVLSLAVPTLVLQPLVENAIRHGVETVAGPARVRIAAARLADRLTVTITNTTGAAAGGSGGLGIQNARRRLEHRHGADFALDFERADGLAKVSLTVPARLVTGSLPVVAPDADPVIPPVRPISNRTGALLAVGVWTGVLALWALAVRTSASLTGAPAWGSWLMAVEAAGNLLVTLAAVGLLGALRRRGVPHGWALGVGFVIAAGLAAGVAVGTVALESPSPNAGWLRANWAEQRFAVLAAILVGAHSWWQYRSRADAAAAAEAVREAAERTRFAQLRWRVQPGLVREVLQRAASLAATSPERAEALTLGLSRLLRSMLAEPDDDWAPLRAEVGRAADLAALHHELAPDRPQLQFTVVGDGDALVPRGVLTELAGTVIGSDPGVGALPTAIGVGWFPAERAFHLERRSGGLERGGWGQALAAATAATGLGRSALHGHGVRWSLAAVPIRHGPSPRQALELEAA
ncbi:MAG: histidine kinase [Gemmatimonadales bacterium]|nr:histidine kinase [Gemmatimonadales bacterium]